MRISSFYPVIAAVVLAAVASQPAMGGDGKYRKLLERYDVADTVRNLRGADAATFWRLATDTDLSLRRFDADMSRKGGAQEEALRELAATPRLYPEYSQAIDLGLQDYCDSLMQSIGVSWADDVSQLYVLRSPQPALFFMLTDDGYATCVTTALYDNPALSDDMLMAMVVGQYVHGPWRHPLERYFDDARSKRKGRLWGAVALAGLVATDVALAAVTPSYPADYTYIDLNVNVNNGDGSGQGAPSAPGFYFSKDQIFQADLIAYRFMEWLGKGDAYIESLKLLEATGTPEATNDGAPDYTERINFLSFVADNPALGNKEHRQAALKELEKIQKEQNRRRR